MEIMPHLKLSDELNIKYAILPGDPARVDRIAEQLEEVQPLAYNQGVQKHQRTYIKGFRYWRYRLESEARPRESQWRNLSRIGVTHAIRIGSCGASADKHPSWEI